MYAIIQTGGKQYKVEVGDEVLIAAEANRRLQVGQFYMARITGAYENDLIAQLC